MPDTTHSLSSTKIQRPRVGSRLVPRPRLVEQLNPPNSLTFILAPAGYGKTTLLSTWLETCHLPTAWLSLDEHDNDLAVFATGLAEALRGILPAMLDNTLTALNGITLPPFEEITRILLNDLSLIQQDFILVLDDYHVILNRAIHDLLLELVSHLPQPLHLVIASRYDPPFLLAGLRARGYVTELRGGDLRFTPQEAGQFLAETMALTLDEQTISVLAAKTEGWPAGLRLAALSLRQQRPLALLAPDGLGHNLYIIDYLVAEVLLQLPLSVQEFLIKCSILDQLCRPLCEAVTGMVDLTVGEQPILEWLERADFFLAAMDDQRHWYRCHQLFRQLLHDRLEQQYGPVEMAALQLRASAWFADNGYLDEALHFAQAGNDLAAAVQIIAQHRQDLMNRDQWQRLDRWLQLFPREVIDEQPHLLLLEVWLKFNRQQLGEAAVLLDRVEALLPGLSPEIGMPLQGEVKAWRSGLLYWSGDFAHSITTARQALAEIPPQCQYLRGYARVFLSGDYVASGDLTRAFATLYATGEPDQGREYQQFLIGLACFIHWITADLAGLGQAARQVVADDIPADRAAIVTWPQFYLGVYYYQRNELADAEKYLEPLVAQPYFSQANCFLNSAVLLARIRQRQGHPEEAQKIAQSMTSFALETNSEVVLLGARAFQAELAWRQGRLAEASQWAAPRATQSGTFRRVTLTFPFVPPLVRARILVAQDTPASRQQARELLTQMDDYYGSIHFTAIRISVLALLALLHSAEGDEQQALAALSHSIALAEPGGFIRLFVDLGTALRPLLKKLVQRGVSPRYLADILAAFDAEDAWPPAGQPPRTEPVSSSSALLTNREQEVLQLLARRCTDKEIAETLVISPNTVSSHIDHLSEKLGARGRRAIVQAAKDQGLLA
jgi:LuxR family transcriptional regulator, maltose regulon positive regulatory protein